MRTKGPDVKLPYLDGSNCVVAHQSIPHTKLVLMLVAIRHGLIGRHKAVALVLRIEYGELSIYYLTIYHSGIFANFLCRIASTPSTLPPAATMMAS